MEEPLGNEQKADTHLLGKTNISDVISRLKSIRRFNLAHYREGEFGIETEQENCFNGDYIDSYEIDEIIRELENGFY